MLDMEIISALPTPRLLKFYQARRKEFFRAAALPPIGMSTEESFKYFDRIDEMENDLIAVKKLLESRGHVARKLMKKQGRG